MTAPGRRVMMALGRCVGRWEGRGGGIVSTLGGGGGVSGLAASRGGGSGASGASCAAMGSGVEAAGGASGSCSGGGSGAGGRTGTRSFSGASAASWTAGTGRRGFSGTASGVRCGAGTSAGAASAASSTGGRGTRGLASRTRAFPATTGRGNSPGTTGVVAARGLALRSPGGFGSSVENAARGLALRSPGGFGKAGGGGVGAGPEGISPEAETGDLALRTVGVRRVSSAGWGCGAEVSAPGGSGRMGADPPSLWITDSSTAARFDLISIPRSRSLSASWFGGTPILLASS